MYKHMHQNGSFLLAYLFYFYHSWVSLAFASGKCSHCCLSSRSGLSFSITTGINRLVYMLIYLEWEKRSQWREGGRDHRHLSTVI